MAFFENESFYDDIAKQVLTRYECTQGCMARLLHLSENITYLIKNEETGFRSVLRIARPGYNTREEIDAELVWIDQIAQTTPIVVSHPYAGKNGGFVQAVPTPSGDYNCVLFEFMAGEAPDEEDETHIREHFASLGEITACLHNQVKGWDGSRSLKRFVWDNAAMVGDTARFGSWRAAPDLTPETEKLFEKTAELIRKRLLAYGTGSDRFGLIHADLRLANLLIDKGTIKVIDFDDCGYGWFLHDLASAVSFIEHKEITPSLIEAWLSGYRRAGTLTDEDLAEVDTFVMQRRLQLLSWLATHYESDPVKELSVGFTAGTAALVEKYLAKFS